jgi:hypothetical protein
MAARNYFGFLAVGFAAAFFGLRGRETPCEPLVILPFLVFLSPFPMVCSVLMLLKGIV